MEREREKKLLMKGEDCHTPKPYEPTEVISVWTALFHTEALEIVQFPQLPDDPLLQLPYNNA